MAAMLNSSFILLIRQMESRFLYLDMFQPLDLSHQICHICQTGHALEEEQLISDTSLLASVSSEKG